MQGLRHSHSISSSSCSSVIRVSSTGILVTPLQAVSQVQYFLVGHSAHRLGSNPPHLLKLTAGGGCFLAQLRFSAHGPATYRTGAACAPLLRTWPRPQRPGPARKHGP